MGSPYSDTLQASGGAGLPFGDTWDVASGALPPGLSLTASGAIVGVPSDTGMYAFVARVSNLFQQQLFADTIVVTAPVLSQSDVVAEVLNGSSALTDDQRRYLDLLGNHSCVPTVIPGCVDVGDFLAWVKATGATPGAPITAGTNGKPAPKGSRP
jgi:hypothetical protein